MSDFDQSKGVDAYIRRRRWRRNAVIAAILLLATVPIALLFSAKAFELQATPARAAATVSLERANGALLILGARVLLFSEEGGVTVAAEGYVPAVVDLSKASGQQQIAVSLEALPGKVVIEVDSATDFELFVDQDTFSGAPIVEAELKPGPHRVRIQGDWILPIEELIEVIGYGEEQRFEFTTEPSASTFTVQALPSEAEIVLDGVRVGRGSHTGAVTHGLHEMEVSLHGYHSVQRQFTAVPGGLAGLGLIELAPKDATLTLSSAPAGASVLVDGRFVGDAPIRIQLASLQTHNLTVRKSGHDVIKSQIRPGPGEIIERTFNLGGHSFDAEVSADLEARVTVNGTDRGATPIRLRVREGDRIGVVREGYQAQSVVVAAVGGPKRNYAFKMMRPDEWAFQQAPMEARAADGSVLRKFPPVRFPSWLADAQGQGVEKVLTRAFYIGRREVDYNGFRTFHPIPIPAGLSGEHPVAVVTWSKVAEFCNWLSLQEGLTPVYEFGSRGELRRVVSSALGYRLPTETEWEAVIGYDFSRNRPVGPFPWGGRSAIPRAYANLAGRETQTLGQRFLASYADNHALTAPTGTYPANFNGLYDLTGNVAEWVTDYYSSAPPNSGDGPLVDSLGPAQGVDHVVKGSSFKSHALATLASGHRAFEPTKSDAVGFRIAKWIY